MEFNGLPSTISVAITPEKKPAASARDFPGDVLVGKKKKKHGCSSVTVEWMRATVKQHEVVLVKGTTWGAQSRPSAPTKVKSQSRRIPS